MPMKLKSVGTTHVHGHGARESGVGRQVSGQRQGTTRRRSAHSRQRSGVSRAVRSHKNQAFSVTVSTQQPSSVGRGRTIADSEYTCVRVHTRHGHTPTSGSASSAAPFSVLRVGWSIPAPTHNHKSFYLLYPFSSTNGNAQRGFV